MSNQESCGRWRTFARSPFVLALCSFVVYWLSLDPVGLAFTVPLVPAIWYPLYYMESRRTREPKDTEPKELEQNDAEQKDVSGGTKGAVAPRRRLARLKRLATSFYAQLWYASVLFWAVIAFWLTYPHPATILGWLGVAFYIGCYFPLYIALCRTVLRRYPFLILFVTPIAWLVTEWFRKHLLGGFSFASLEHALYRYPRLIQTADLYGEYTVGTLIVLFGTLLALCVARIRKRRFEIAAQCAIAMGLLTAFVFLYGQKRLETLDVAEKTGRADAVAVKIALLQERTTFRFPVADATNREIHQTYLRLAANAVRATGPYDLIVWPESSFMMPRFEFTSTDSCPELADKTPEERKEWVGKYEAHQDARFASVARELGAAVILGTTTVVYGPGEPEYLNTALFVDRAGKATRYDKMTLVIFGEYLPFANLLPAWFPLKTLCNSVTPGKSPVAFVLDCGGKKINIAANICFESSIPHLVWGQVATLKRQGCEPDILVNISNDGWYQYSPQIDYHLAAHVFRAIENRKHFLSATHAGYAAWIDPGGRIRARGKRRVSEAVGVEIKIAKP